METRRTKQKRRRAAWLWGAALCAACLAVLCLAAGSGRPADAKPRQAAPSSVHIPLSQRISNYEEVIASIRHGMRYHAQAITVTFSYGEDILRDVSDVVEAWVEEALQETGESTEGDYIRYQYGGYEIECSCTQARGEFHYTVEIKPKYYMYLADEEAVAAALAEIEENFGFTTDTTDYEKIRTIYDYVCQNVRYDLVHRGNPHFHMKSTAYAALIWHTATCQGYCVTLYRMLRDAGIDARVVTGTGYGEGTASFHAWNIVKLDGRYYNLDATWDASQDAYAYFLRGSGNFTDHEPGEAFRSLDFLRQYPMAEEDYPPEV